MDKYNAISFRYAIQFVLKKRSERHGLRTLDGCTGSQLELSVCCSLKDPSKVSRMARMEKAQTADPGMEFGGVVNTA